MSNDEETRQGKTDLFFFTCFDLYANRLRTSGVFTRI